jgi:2-(1,2-epoxy-1,2-dihydrophenyl)acetyl-CoA isomerase
VSLYGDLLNEGGCSEQRLVTVTRVGARATVTLEEPARLNVLSAPLVLQTKQALSELSADPDVRVVVLTGAGRAFSAGGDLRVMALAEQRLHEDPGVTDVWRWIRREFGGVAHLLAGSDTTFIAALNGPAAGVGLAWALACDVIVASAEAVLVPAFGGLGLLPEVGTSWALTRRLGYQGAFAFFVEGRRVSAAQALELGLVQELVAPDELEAAVERWCDRVIGVPSHAVAMAKPLLRAAADAGWETALTMEEFAEPNCFTTAPFHAAVRARLEDSSS